MRILSESQPYRQGRCKIVGYRRICSVEKDGACIQGNGCVIRGVQERSSCEWDGISNG